MLSAQTLIRTFTLPDGTTLPDPDSRLSPDAVRHFYTHTHPELVNATVGAPLISGDTHAYPITVKFGTKG